MIELYAFLFVNFRNCKEIYFPKITNLSRQENPVSPPTKNDCFFASVADMSTINSPLNYTGGKYKLLPQILPLFPIKISAFVDLFCGGCNVGINVAADKIYFNDNNEKLIYLYGTLKNLDADAMLEIIYGIIDKYNLSLAAKNGYAYYGCESNTGLSAYNKSGFNKLREDFNKTTTVDYHYYLMLFVIIVYSFNNQIRFNSQGKYNLPVGKRDFNDRVRSKLLAFVAALHKRDCTFSCKDFREFDCGLLTTNDFVYADPPYLIACATYNEQGGWSKKDEEDLLSFLDALSAKNISFALSNVLSGKGKTNEILTDWLAANKQRYFVHHLTYNYKNSNYHIKNRESLTDEVLITNYEVDGNAAKNQL